MIGAIPQNTIVKSFDSHFKTSSSKKIFRSLYGIVNFFSRSISPVLSLLPTQFIHHDRTHARTHTIVSSSFSPETTIHLLSIRIFRWKPYGAQTFTHFSHNHNQIIYLSTNFALRALLSFFLTSFLFLLFSLFFFFSLFFSSFFSSFFSPFFLLFFLLFLLFFLFFIFSYLTSGGPFGHLILTPNLVFFCCSLIFCCSFFLPTLTSPS